jgi:hypothetical protein
MAMSAVEGKMCPVFTLAKLIQAPPEALAPSTIVGPAGEKPASRQLEAINCQGPKCVFFQGIVDQNGNVVDGTCAPVMISVHLRNLTTLIGNMVVAPEPRADKAQSAPAAPQPQAAPQG